MSANSSGRHWADLCGNAVSGAKDSALSPERLCERACHLSRLDDFGATSFMPGLVQLCSSLQEVSLTPMGRLWVSARLTRALVTRLRLVKTLRDEPARFAEPLREPIVIVGPARAGTTFLHHLLCAAPKARFIPFWEVRDPIPDAEEDDRRACAAHAVAMLRENMPELARKHPLDVDAPEECMYLLDPSLRSPSFNVDAPVQSYLEWLRQQNRYEPYQTYRQLLQYIQSSAPDRRLVLKSPSHVSELDALLGAVPEAKIVQLHRDPLAILPSWCSLLETNNQIGVAALDRGHLGTRLHALLEYQLARNAEHRASLEPGLVFDLKFNELTSDPVGSVRRIYEYFGWIWSEAANDNLLAYVASHTAEHVARRQYRLADFGLVESEIVERFRDYRERWGFSS